MSSRARPNQARNQQHEEVRSLQRMREKWLPESSVGRLTTVSLALLVTLGAVIPAFGNRPARSAEYARAQRRLARGWNTWNTQSVLSHVLLPEGFAVNLGLKRNDYLKEAYLRDALIGRHDPQSEQVHPGLHVYDGSYTELTLTWQNIKVRVQSATEGDDLVLLVTPLSTSKIPSSLVVESAILWNRNGTLSLRGDAIIARLPLRTIAVYPTKKSNPDTNLPAQTPHLVLALDSPAGISTGSHRSLSQIRDIIERRKSDHLTRAKKYGDLAEVFEALQSVMAWNTIFDPRNNRVISPVSRLWSKPWGGYVLFCWDTFFAAYMAGVSNKDLAYANAIEIVREKTPKGFVPNFAQGKGWNSYDRSQPPVGSLVVLDLYRKYGEAWFLEEVFDDLLTWNRWWANARNYQGLLCWGSDPSDAFWESSDLSVHTLRGAKYESGLDNSPMYDGVTFNKQTHLMELSDVGLNSLYVADCDALAEMARVLGRKKEAAELKDRADAFRKSLTTLWSETEGIFLNRRTDTGEFSTRLSPTNFYPLLARAATRRQAERMIKEHLYNTDEFWGEWVIPSTPRNGAAFIDQRYWRGRIWAPTNFLLYRGLLNYDLAQARKDLAKKSKELLLKEWRAQGHVHENYNAMTGEGDDVRSSDPFHHWGALLGLIPLIEEKRFALH